jgi:hypothetical protein
LVAGHLGKKPDQFVSELVETRLCAAGLQVNHYVEARDGVAINPAAEDLSHSAFHPVSRHRAADFAACGDAEACVRSVVGVEVKSCRPAPPPTTLSVAEQKVGATSHPLPATKPLAFRG